MKKLVPTQGKEAALYLRVSTAEQADPLNLERQEAICKRLCEQRGLPVAASFLGPGESARSAERKSFRNLLSYCTKNHNKVGFVIVETLSRFARNVTDQGNAVAELRKHGITLLSVAEPNIDDTAAGKLAANIHGAFNQYFSDALSEKMRDRSAASVRGGRWPWAAPIGYLNDLNLPNGANIKPDPETAPLIREAFTMYATGDYTKMQVLEHVTEKGLRTKRGRKLTPQTFDELLKKPVYAGWVTSRTVAEPVRGRHTAVVSQEVFDNVQRVLTGKRLSSAPKRKHNPDFPLKHFVRCGECGTPLTGGMNKGKLKHYANYWCRNPLCRAVKVSRDKLHADWLAHLKSLQPDPATIAQFPSVAADVWATRQGDAKEATKRLNDRLAEQKRLKSELLKAKLRGEVNQTDYAAANEDFDAEIEDATERLHALGSQRSTLEAFVRFAKLLLVDIAGAWERANPTQKLGVQNFLFFGGISYTEKSGFLNTTHPALYHQLALISHGQNGVGVPDGI